MCWGDANRRQTTCHKFVMLELLSSITEQLKLKGKPFSVFDSASEDENNFGNLCISLTP